MNLAHLPLNVSTRGSNVSNLSDFLNFSLYTLVGFNFLLRGWTNL